MDLWNVPLVDADPEVADLVEKEKNRQWRGIELIASEVGFRTRAHARGTTLCTR